MKKIIYFVSVFFFVLPSYGKLKPKGKAEKKMVNEWKKVWKNPGDYIPYHGGGLHHRVSWRLYVTKDTSFATNYESGPICLLLGQKDTVHFRWGGENKIGTTSISLLNLVGRNYANPHNGRFQPLPEVHSGYWILATGWLQYATDYNDAGPELYLNCEEIVIEKKY